MSVIFLPFLLIRSCVDESELCKGVSLCNNKEDLKWCKGTSVWAVPDNWTALDSVSNDGEESVQAKCTFFNDTDPTGQWINPEDQMDGNKYHCINRTDENPFSKRKQSTDDKTWLDWVNSPCHHEPDRRCLGDKPNQCVCE